jgi:carboxyl-terminal processing protease
VSGQLIRLTTARYFTPSGRSIQAKGISPNIEVLQEVPEELKARTDTRGEASLRGHLKAEGDEQTGSQSYVPPDPKDDKALHTALDLIRGIQKNSAYPPTPKTAAADHRHSRPKRNRRRARHDRWAAAVGVGCRPARLRAPI